MEGNNNTIEVLAYRAFWTSIFVSEFLIYFDEVKGTHPENWDRCHDDPLHFQEKYYSKWKLKCKRYKELFRRIFGRTYPDKIIEVEKRICAIIYKELCTGDISKRVAWRPDILRLSCKIVTDPDEPSGDHVSKHSVVLALRTIYRIQYSEENLRLVHDAYKNILERFRKKKRRQRKVGNEIENFLIDILCMEGHIYRSLNQENLKEYYHSFLTFPFGITVKRNRQFSKEADWPQLFKLSSSLPDFASLINIIFGQPIPVQGFDQITGGLMPSMPSSESRWKGGLVSLIAGPPGSGKTTLCISIASKMSHMGSYVRYIATEETISGLEAKRISLGEEDRFEDGGGELNRFEIITADRIGSLQELSQLIENEMETTKNLDADEELGGEIYSVFPRVIVIDSINLLFQFQNKDDSSNEDRKMLSFTLNELRRLGICVFLVGGIEERTKLGLDYLVDNVFLLDYEERESPSHPVRTFTVDKTRLQTSHRGRHVFHISRRSGCSINQSLHSVLRTIKGTEHDQSDDQSIALVFPDSENPNENQPITLRNRSQILIYGHGSAHKAHYAMNLASEPRISIPRSKRNKRNFSSYLSLSKQNYLKKMKILVVSFLYGAEYYEGIARRMLVEKYGVDWNDSKTEVDNRLTVLPFYPGYIDAETLVAKVRTEIEKEKMKGGLFTSAIVDGVHNLVLQFPLLEPEALLWPTLYKLFRAEGMNAISTFTFFRIEQMSWKKQEPNYIEEKRRQESNDVIKATERLFHLLISSCDYSFRVEKPSPYPEGIDRNKVQILLTSTIDGFNKESGSFWWDPQNLVSSVYPE